MYVICIKDENEPLGYRLFCGFRSPPYPKGQPLDMNGRICVQTFTRADAKYVCGVIYFTAEQVGHEVVRVTEILKTEMGKEAPFVYAKSMVELKEECLAWR